MKKIAVFGLGRVGKLAALLLADEGFEVIGIDQVAPSNFPLPFEQVNVNDEKAVVNILSRVDAVASCLPYHLTLHLAKLAYTQGVHYFDLTEDRETTLQIKQWPPGIPWVDCNVSLNKWSGILAGQAASHGTYNTQSNGTC